MTTPVGARLAALKPAASNAKSKTRSRARGTNVTPTSTHPAAPKLRPLNQPSPIEVETNGHGAPTTIVISKARRAVDAVTETWRIDDEWWRTYRISRTYYRLLLEDAHTVDVYHDLARNRWYKQAYTT